MHAAIASAGKSKQRLLPSVLVGQEIAEAHALAEQSTSKARIEAENSLADLRRHCDKAGADLDTLEQRAKELRQTVGELEETADFQSFGYHHKRYSFEASAQYQRLLEQVCGEQKVMVKTKRAASCSVEWTVNGSATEGRKAINQTLKLMLRAFNGEADAAIAKVNYKNLSVMEKRIQATYDAVNKLAEVQQCSIA